MNLYTTLRTSIRNVVLKALSTDFSTMPCIFSHQSGGEPAESYSTIYVLSARQIGHSQTGTLTNTTEELSFGVVYEADIQISFFGSLSGDAIHSFVQNINNNPIVLEEIKKNNLGFMRKTQIRSNPQKRDTQWVDSFNITLTVNYIVGSTQLVDVVENVILEQQYNGVVPPFGTNAQLISSTNSQLDIIWEPSFDGEQTFNGAVTYDSDGAYVIITP